VIKKILNRNIATLLFLVITAIALQGCGENYADEAKRHHKAVTAQLVELKHQLDSGTVRNAVIVKSYAEKLSRQDPSMEPIAKAMALDATSSGAPYQSLVTRLAVVNLEPQDEKSYLPIKQELDSIYAGSDSAVFNDSQLDLANTLADLSQGKLPRLNIPKNARNEQTVPGSYLVGNPQYGQYRTNSQGSSFWEWYGKYAMFSHVLGAFTRGPIYYNSWYSRPHYSYYHDYGRSTYGTSRARQSWSTGSNKLREKGVKVAKPKKNYGSLAGQRKVSTYNRGGTYKNSSRQYGAKNSYSGGRKNYASGSRSSSYSGYGSSSRGTSFGSRSFRSGK